jgi:hypothetical protein
MFRPRCPDQPCPSLSPGRSPRAAHAPVQHRVPERADATRAAEEHAPDRVRKLGRLRVVREARGAARAAEAERDERAGGLARGDVAREERAVGEARARERGLGRRAARVREVEGGRVARAGEEGVEERDGEDVDRAVAAVVGEVALVVS